MKCEQCCEYLALYVDGSLSEKEMDLVKNHLKNCSACSEECRQLTQTVDLVCKLNPIAAPHDFHSRFTCRLDEECKKSWLTGFWGYGTMGIAAAAAATVLIVVFNAPLQQKFSTVTSPMAKMKNHANTAVADVKPTEKQAQTAAIGLARSTGLLPTRRRQEPLQADNSNATVAVGYGPVTTDIPSKNNFNPLIQSTSLGSRAANQAADATEMYPTDIKKTTRLYRQEQEWGGEHCAQHKPDNQVINNPTEADQLWQRAQLNFLPQPKIDWASNRLGAIFLGDQAGTNFRIQIDEIDDQGKNLTIKYRIIPPASSNAKTSQPFLIFLLPNSGQNVDFVLEP